MDIFDSTAAEWYLEHINPGLKAEIDSYFEKGQEQILLKQLLYSLDSYITGLNSELEGLSGLIFEANVNENTINTFKPKRVRVYSFDFSFIQNNPLQDSIRFDDLFRIPLIYQDAIEHVKCTDSSNELLIDITQDIFEYYNEHPGGSQATQHSVEKISTEGYEWVAGGFENWDGPVDGTNATEDPWAFDAPFGCDFCHIQKIDST